MRRRGPAGWGGQEPGAAAGWERLPDGPLSGRVGAVVAAVGGERWEGSDGELLAEAWIWRPPGE